MSRSEHVANVALAQLAHARAQLDTLRAAGLELAPGYSVLEHFDIAKPEHPGYDPRNNIGRAVAR